jgi:predicted 3-demethylubiquinone-9 3-methyltransferase (glyoxalase superfamily)
MPTITPFLWFEKNAEEAMNFYTSAFKNSKVGSVRRYPKGSPGDMDGQVMTADFELEGQSLIILNGGLEFRQSEAFSLFVEVEDQTEVDYYWEKLTADGGEESVCGWLKDKYGLSWQIVPKALNELIGDPDPEKSQRAMAAMLKMRKIIVADLEAAVNSAE